MTAPRYAGRSVVRIVLALVAVAIALYVLVFDTANEVNLLAAAIIVLAAAVLAP